jgi:hypothetical protein
MLRPCAFGLMLMASAFACGCASTSGDHPPSLVSESPLAGDAPPSAYQLSEREQKYDCKKLTGVMQVRLLQVRDYEQSSKPTLAARGMQTVATPIWGGTTTGMDPDGQHRKDLAMLQAYNAQLAAKNCKTFDLDAELKGRGLLDMPRPVGSKKQP